MTDTRLPIRPETVSLPAADALYRNRTGNAISLDNAAASGDPETEKLKAACDSFEALLMQQMLKQMRATVPKDGLFSGGSAEQLYTEMLDAEVSKEMAADGGLGISRLLFEHMMAAQRSGKEIKS